MSAAAAAEAPPPAKGKKKLVLILAIVGVLVAGGGGAAVFMMKKKAAAEAEAEEGGAGDHAPAKKAAAPKHDPKAVPAFVPLDPFTVNLADREAERYAQIGITLEIEDAKLADQIKNYMPAIRHNILMAIADRTAGELMGREGKAKLAERVRKETAKALGYEPDEDEEEAADEHAPKAEAKGKKKAKKRAAPPPLPIKAVHFSNFIIQ